MMVLGLGGAAVCYLMARQIPNLRKHSDLPQSAAPWWRQIITLSERGVLLPASLMFCNQLSFPAITSFIVLYAREIGIESIGILTRRNIVTRGVPLIELLGHEFTIGNVRMRGIRLFEPCGHLVAVTKIPAIFKALEHRSGLKAAVLSDGDIQIGDAVVLESANVAVKAAG